VVAQQRQRDQVARPHAVDRIVVPGVTVGEFGGTLGGRRVVFATSRGGGGPGTPGRAGTTASRGCATRYRPSASTTSSSSRRS
jgi:hypothetical protein